MGWYRELMALIRLSCDIQGSFSFFILITSRVDKLNLLISNSAQPLQKQEAWPLMHQFSSSHVIKIYVNIHYFLFTIE